MLDVQNVLLFVSDSFRYDYLPEDLRDEGVVFKTVAQSTHSPPSFTTLSTGRYPPEHGVHKFGEALVDDVTTLYNCDVHDGLYFNEGRFMHDSLYKVYDVSDPRHLSEVDEPFWYLERDTTPHAPYVKNGFLQGYDAHSYFEDVTDTEAHRADYRAVGDESIKLFRRRADVLERLDRLDDTLLIFTADHGEAFGERGPGGHGIPIVPEMVYVPTVFIHPSLDESAFHADPETDVIEHVDVVETALNMVGRGDAVQTSGTDLTSQQRDREWGYSHVHIRRGGRTFYHADSLWGFDGGHVFHRNGRAGRLAAFVNSATRAMDQRTVRANALQTFRTYMANRLSYDDPPLSSESAKAAVTAFRESIENREGGEFELDEQARQALEDLGYIT
jgi:arylsulfatase A-like enzyme